MNYEDPREVAKELRNIGLNHFATRYEREFLALIAAESLLERTPTREQVWDAFIKSDTKHQFHQALGRLYAAPASEPNPLRGVYQGATITTDCAKCRGNGRVGGLEHCDCCKGAGQVCVLCGGFAPDFRRDSRIAGRCVCFDAAPASTKGAS